MMLPQAHILIVEDDAKIAALLVDYFADSGYRSTWLGDGRQALDYLRAQAVDLVILDLMLPGLDGIAVCKAVRQFSEVPIIMLTARVAELDRLLGLDSGADDYVCKPFSPREVVARVRARLRHSRPPAPPQDMPMFQVDPDAMHIRINGNPLILTPAEFRLLAEFCRHPGRVFSRQQLLDCLHDSQRDSSDRTVDSDIKNVRRKIAEHLPDCDCLQSVYGVGYRFELPDQ